MTYCKFIFLCTLCALCASCFSLATIFIFHKISHNIQHISHNINKMANYANLAMQKLILSSWSFREFSGDFNGHKNIGCYRRCTCNRHVCKGKFNMHRLCLLWNRKQYTPSVWDEHLLSSGWKVGGTRVE